MFQHTTVQFIIAILITQGILGGRDRRSKSVERFESVEKGDEVNESVGWSERDKQESRRESYENNKRQATKRKEKKPVVECHGGIVSWCQNGQCTIKCGDGTEVCTLMTYGVFQ